MRYRRGYKYQLAEDVWLQTSFRPEKVIQGEWFELHADGNLRIKRGYAWDGASGPVADRDTNRTPSCGHDVLYQMLREGLLPFDLWRQADKDFVRWEDERGAWKITQKIDLAGLKIAGGKAAHPKSRKKVYEAP